jgi:hypothetical protein
VDNESLPQRMSFETAGFPQQGALFKFAVGGNAGARTKIVNQLNEAAQALKSIANLNRYSEFQNMKNFLTAALDTVRSGADSDVYFHYNLESSPVAVLCAAYIHACGFEHNVKVSFGVLLIISFIVFRLQSCSFIYLLYSVCSRFRSHALGKLYGIRRCRKLPCRCLITTRRHCNNRRSKYAIQSCWGAV